jgi:aspartate 1-decarboxylase
MNRTMLKSKIHRCRVTGVIVSSYAAYDERELETYEPKVVHVSADNSIVTVGDAVAELLS